MPCRIRLPFNFSLGVFGTANNRIAVELYQINSTRTKTVLELPWFVVLLSSERISAQFVIECVREMVAMFFLTILSLISRQDHVSSVAVIWPVFLETIGIALILVLFGARWREVHMDFCITLGLFLSGKISFTRLKYFTFAQLWGSLLGSTLLKTLSFNIEIPGWDIHRTSSTSAFLAEAGAAALVTWTALDAWDDDYHRSIDRASLVREKILEFARIEHGISTKELPTQFSGSLAAVQETENKGQNEMKASGEEDFKCNQEKSIERGEGEPTCEVTGKQWTPTALHVLWGPYLFAVHFVTRYFLLPLSGQHGGSPTQTFGPNVVLWAVSPSHLLKPLHFQQQLVFVAAPTVSAFVTSLLFAYGPFVFGTSSPMPAHSSFGTPR